jgi:hypothetical protein
MTIEEQNVIAIEALKNILVPLKYLKAEAESQGAKLNGFMVNQLLNDPNYYKEIAKTAIRKIYPNGIEL